MVIKETATTRAISRATYSQAGQSDDTFKSGQHDKQQKQAGKEGLSQKRPPAVRQVPQLTLFFPTLVQQEPVWGWGGGLQYYWSNWQIIASDYPWVVQILKWGTRLSL